ncbi:MAG: LON peptidase substrate-binding domain-containing protein [Acidobacteriota bacterium]
MNLRSPQRRLLLFPLSDEVHFPLTELRLHVLRHDYCGMVRDLHRREGSRGQLGIVLLKPDWPGGGAPPVYAAGTAARLMGLAELDDGCEIVLRGEFRFELEKEVSGHLGREALVRPVTEPSLSEQDPDVLHLRQEILQRTSRLSEELGNRFDLGADEMRDLSGDLTFEAMVNHLAANMEMSPVRKLQLLRHTVSERALHLLTILRSRQQVLDVLRPYRHLAADAERN